MTKDTRPTTRTLTCGRGEGKPRRRPERGNDNEFDVIRERRLKHDVPSMTTDNKVAIVPARRCPYQALIITAGIESMNTACGVHVRSSTVTPKATFAALMAVATCPT
jgi:hypothetical protein